MFRRFSWIAGVMIFLGLVFCGGFFYFRDRMQRSQAEAVAPDDSKSLINKPFPRADLVDASGAKVNGQTLMTGRVVVVFVTMDCDACATEGRFLEAVIGRRKDVAFYGVVPFGTRPQNPQATLKRFPFKLLYDEGNAYVATMGINRVPVKVFLEDGIIKKGWIGAALTDKAKASFTEWLDSLP